MIIINDAIEEDKAYFFTTSTIKLVLMSICTFGLYEQYWFYNNWVLIKERTGSNIVPLWRTFFALMWADSCFKQIKSSAEENAIQESLPVGLLGIIYFILCIIHQSHWLMSFFSFVVIIPANRVALRVNKKIDPDFVNNEKFSVLNWVVLVFGLYIFGHLFFIEFMMI